jgi:hypothetical protein
MLRDVILARIADQLRKLPTEKLAAILDFVESQSAKQGPQDRNARRPLYDTPLTTDWSRPEDLEAWRNL